LSSASAPSEPDTRAVVLGEDPPLGRGASRSQPDERRRAGPFRKARNRQHLADRREDVGDLHRRLDARAGQGASGELDQERDLNRLAVEKDAVLHLAVVSEAFSVIGEEEDQGPVVETDPLELGEEPSHDCVGIRDLPVIGIAVA